MATTMDPITLLYRNAALETELRLVKEQLVHAHNANQYLLGRLSSSAHGLQSSSSNNFQGFLLDEQAGTHPHEAVSPIRRSTCGCGDSSSTSAAHGSEQRKDSLVDLFSDATGDSVIDELIQLDEVTYTASGNVASQSPDDEAVVRKPLKKDSVGLGISTISLHGTSADDSSLNHSPYCGPLDASGGALIYQRDGTTIYLPMPPPEGISQWTAAGTPQSKPLPFQDSVHNQLLGRACFLEDETEEERAKHWIEYTKLDGRHTAEEYAAYYSEVIRPQHLAKMRDRENMMRDTAIDAGLSEERASSHSGTTSESTKEPKTELNDYLDVGLQADIALPVVADPEVTDESAVGPLQSGLVLESEAMAIPARGEMTLGVDEPENNVAIRQMRETDIASSSTTVSPTSGPEASFLRECHQSCIPTLSKLTGDSPALTPSASLEAAKAFRDELRKQSPPGHPIMRGPRNGQFHSPRHPLNTQGHHNPTSVADLFAKPAKEDLHPFHTVLITNIPLKITLVEVLSKVKGGKIFSATLCETTNMRTKPMMETNTVLLTFVSGEKAEKFVKRHTKEEILFHDDTELQPMLQARVKLLETTSRPIPAWALYGLREHGLSRVFFVHDQVEKWTLQDAEMQLMRGGARKPLRMSFGESVNGLMLFEFASLDEARKAYDVVRREYWYFRGVDCGFFTDPCEGEVAGMSGREKGVTSRQV